MLWALVLAPLVGAALTVFLRGPERRALVWTACAALVATLTLVPLAASGDWAGTVGWSAQLRLHLALTPAAVMMAALVPAIALPVVAYAAVAESRVGLGRLIALLLFFVAAMELVVLAADLLSLLTGWEIVGACSWALIAHEWRDPARPAAGRYAFVTTRIGDLGLFVAAMATFAGSGSFEYSRIAALPPHLLQIVAFGIVLSAAAKAGQMPFSPWLFRAMLGPAPVSALLHSATMVAAGAYLLVRLEPMLRGVPGFGATTLAIGVATALAGGIVALVQRDAKKVLAASTSAQLGLMFAAVGAGFPGIALLHLVLHAAFKALLFLSAGAAAERTGTLDLSRWRLGRQLPALAWIAGVGVAALAALPPLGAAWTKEQIVDAAAATGPVPAGLVIVAGGLSAAYAARFFLLAFGRRDHEPVEALGPVERGALGALAVVVIASCVIELPAVQALLLRALQVDAPAGVEGTSFASLILVAAGVLAGRALARGPLRDPPSQVADWLGLPVLLQRAIVRPVLALANALAWADRRVLAAGPRAVGEGSTRVAAILHGVDERGIDGVVRSGARAVQIAAVVATDGGERIVEGVVAGSAHLVALSGDDARRLHTGLSQHAFAMALVGAALLAVLVLA